MSGIGPVESVDSTDVDGSYEVIGGDSPRLTDRWHTLPQRTRRTALAVIAVVAAAVGAVLLPPVHDDRQSDPTPPVPWPANVTAWRYVGLAQTTDTPTTTGFFRFAVTVGSGPPSPSTSPAPPSTDSPPRPYRNRTSPSTPDRPTASRWRFPFPTVRDCP